MIAEESTAWPKVTGAPEDDGRIQSSGIWADKIYRIYEIRIRAVPERRIIRCDLSMEYAYSENIFLARPTMRWCI